MGNDVKLLPKKKQYFAIGMFAFLATFWAWRVQYGGADMHLFYDGSFYTSIPYRMLFGDTLLLDETNTTQMVAFLLFPLVKVWSMVTGGNTEGIVLFFRYVWVGWNIAVSAGVYLLCSRHGYRTAVCCTLIHSLAVPVMVTALGYNVIALSSVTLLILLYYFAYNSVAANVAKGFLLAMVVLCNPFALVIYAALVILFAVNLFTVRDKQLQIKSILALHLGILLLLIPFLTYLGIELVKRGLSVSDFIHRVVYMLSIDSSHNGDGSIITFIKIKLYFVKEFLQAFPLYIPPYLGILIAGLVSKKSKKYCIPALMVLNALFSVYALVVFRNSFIWVFGGLLGIAVCLLHWDMIRKQALHSWVLAFMFVVSADLCSDTRLHAVSWACSVFYTLSFLTIEDIFRAREPENAAKTDRNHILFDVAICVIILAVFGMNLKYVYQDEDLPLLTARVSQGPMKGIYTTPEKLEGYTRTNQELQSIPLTEDDNVLLLPTRPIDLFTLQREVCSPSTWFRPTYFFDEKLHIYYQDHPEKAPTVVIINKSIITLDLGSKVAFEDIDFVLLFTRNGYAVERNNDVCIVLRKSG